VNGRVVSKGGHLLVGETAILEADIDVAAASISGTVSGTLMASSRVEIHPTGKVFGDIHSPALIMEEGAIHDGRNEMSKAKAPKPLDEVRPERPLKTGAA
jgi:cytoskeletal protein CcmA (bactofilin family)